MLRKRSIPSEQWIGKENAYRVAVIGARNVRLSTLFRILLAIRSFNPKESLTGGVEEDEIMQDTAAEAEEQGRSDSDMDV